ncbi:MAG: helix-turn-helix domain-containing protein [Bacteroidetes bacterium]|nr:MAG: helix-turn-helix domain-containing protein [Bacteroidota bacterium]
MRFVDELKDGEEDKLKLLMKNCPSNKVRLRANAILLSSNNYSIADIASIFNVHRDTVSNWLRGWENKGLMGLFDEPKPGRPPKKPADEIELVEISEEKN